MEEYEQNKVDKEVDRFNQEIWDLKQKLSITENYIKFKSLWDDFEEVSK